MKLSLLRCSCVLLLFHLSSYAWAQPALRGTVINSSNHEKVQGAVIRLSGSFLTAVTDSAGRFEFRHLDKSRVTLTVSHLSFLPQELQADLPVQDLGIHLVPRIITAEEVTVIALRAGEHSGTASTVIDKKELEAMNLGQDVPYLLQHTPSTVSTSDAGTGIGYTALRIRGSDASRTSVTINGVPVNDAESQAVYWVDFPDFAASTDNVLVQRGLGTSTNGAGAFGASVNIQSAKVPETPYGTVSSSAGTFGTTKNSFGFGTGILNKFSFDGRFTILKSDGFVDRSSSDLKSIYLGGAYTGLKSSVRFLVFSGSEKTGQAWYGVPEAKLRNDAAGLLTHYYNNLGSLYFTPGDSINLFTSDNRTYNYYTYEDQTDNYKQDNYQLHYALTLSEHWVANAALHYTRGSGFYEEFRSADNLSDYGLSPEVIGGDTITSSQLVRRRWLENDFFGTVYSLQYRKDNLSFTFGGAWNRYLGDHFGEITWAEYAVTIPKDYEYYRNDADKKDFNSYSKVTWNVNDRLHLMADIQYRRVDYAFTGYDNALQVAPQHIILDFFNPKAGLNYNLSANQSLYASVGLGNKEPMRDDYVDAPANTHPEPESMIDVEAGYTIRADKFKGTVNVYNMSYTDQLVVTGYINDIGLYPRQNVAESYRRGVEVEATWQALATLKLSGNFTLSQNRIKEYKAYTALYDASFAYAGQEVATYNNTDLAFSPALIAGAIVSWTPVKNLSLNFISKYVGDQYLDNTKNESRKLDAYAVHDIRLNYSLDGVVGRNIGLTLAVYNLFNEKYESNGYTYSYKYDSNLITENYYFPQAGTSFLAGITLKF